jgi:hypothetical protein
MNRRIAVRDLTLALGGLVSIPSWATNGWNAHSFQTIQSSFKVNEQNMLEVIVETIIPESTTKGAKSLGVPAFLQKMLQDCYEAPVSENVKNGLAATDATAQKQFAKSFSNCDTSQKQQILLGFEKSEDTKLKEFYSLVKNLTILGYTTSEYVQTEFLHYNMAPGHYYGCVPIKK